jgi:hypothetical protein
VLASPEATSLDRKWERMAGVNMVLSALISTVYPTEPQLDSNGNRGSVAAVHMTPAGPAILVSLDGVNDHARLDPATAALSISFGNPYYSRVWARLAGAGAATVQLVIEGI